VIELRPAGGDRATALPLVCGIEVQEEDL